MGKITDLQLNKFRREIKLFIDNSFLISVDRDVAIGAGLYIGQDLSVDQIRKLKEASLSQKCFEAALHYLSYRPRTELEVRQRLYQRGFPGDIVHEVIVRLKDQGMINDIAFAQYWKDNRLSFNPKSQRLIKRELKQKGIAIETADEAVRDLDDEANAYKAGLKKARVLAASEYNEFRSRLSSYLRWRGFSYEVIGHVSARLWQEQQTSSE